MTAYGRPDEDWDAPMQAGSDFSCERAAMARNTSYTEMSTTLARRAGVREFDFSQQAERAGMGYLLGRIGEDTYPTVDAMLSAIVLYLDANNAGPGFYALAGQMGLLERGASKQDKERFWVDQVARVFRHFEGKSSRG